MQSAPNPAMTLGSGGLLHAGYVRFVRNHGDNSVLVVDHSGRVGTWDLKHSRYSLMTRFPPGHGAVALSNDNRLLAYCEGVERIIRVIELPSGAEKFKLAGLHEHAQPHQPGNLDQLIFNAGASALYSIEGGRVVRWDLHTGKGAVIHKHRNQNAEAAAVTPDGKILAVSFSSGFYKFELFFLNALDGTICARDKKGGLARQIEFTPDSGHLVGQYCGTLRIYGMAQLVIPPSPSSRAKKIKPSDAPELKPLAIISKAKLGIGDWAHLVMLGNTRVLAVPLRETAAIVDILKKKVTHLASISDSHTFGACILPDGKTVVSGGSDSALTVWELNTGKHLREEDRHRDQIETLAFQPDGTRLVSRCWNGEVRLWDLSSAHTLAKKSLDELARPDFCFTPDSSALFGSSVFYIWKLPSLDTIYGLQGQVWHDPVLSPSGNHVAIFTEKEDLAVLDLQKGAWRRLGKDCEFRRGLVWASGGRELGCLDTNDKNFFLWDVESGRERLKIEMPYDVRRIHIAPDGVTLCALYENKESSSFAKWNLKDASQILSRACPFLKAAPHQLNTRLSPDGSVLACFPRHKPELTFVSTADGSLAAQWEVEASCEALAFSPCGTQIALGYCNGKIALLPLSGIVQPAKITRPKWHSPFVAKLLADLSAFAMLPNAGPD